MKNCVETGKVRQYIIHLNEADLDVGTIFLKNIDKARRCGEPGLFIGEPTYLNAGIGILASLLFSKVIFGELGLDYIYIRVLKSRPGTVRYNRFMGYETVDNPAAWGISDPDDPDCVYMVCTREAFYGSRLGRSLSAG
jgi:hypothetical protein